MRFFGSPDPPPYPRSPYLGDTVPAPSAGTPVMTVIAWGGDGASGADQRNPCPGRFRPRVPAGALRPRSAGRARGRSGVRPKAAEAHREPEARRDSPGPPTGGTGGIKNAGRAAARSRCLLRLATMRLPVFPVLSPELVEGSKDFKSQIGNEAWQRPRMPRALSWGRGQAKLAAQRPSPHALPRRRN
jgi:hypothetical protein